MGLETVEIVMDMEDFFHVEIPDSKASICITVGDLLCVLVDLLIERGRTKNPELEREVWEGMMAVLARNNYDVARIRRESKWIGDVTKYG